MPHFSFQNRKNPEGINLGLYKGIWINAQSLAIPETTVSGRVPQPLTDSVSLQKEAGKALSTAASPLSLGLFRRVFISFVMTGLCIFKGH